MMQFETKNKKMDFDNEANFDLEPSFRVPRAQTF